MNLVVHLLLAPLKLYKTFLSPWLPARCRFHPSCSAYAMGALAVHGPVTGLYLSLRRVARCQPFGGAGLDPVPPRNGCEAAVLLASTEPFVASLLREPCPPHLAALGPTPSPGRP